MHPIFCFSKHKNIRIMIQLTSKHFLSYSCSVDLSSDSRPFHVSCDIASNFHAFPSGPVGLMLPFINGSVGMCKISCYIVFRGITLWQTIAQQTFLSFLRSTNFKEHRYLLKEKCFSHQWDERNFLFFFAYC